MAGNTEKFLLTFYTRSPLHVGCGTSVDIVDLPVMRERITNFPVIPASSLKGVLRQQARDVFNGENPAAVQMLFGEESNDKDVERHAGAVITGEGKLLAFPVRSLKGCFAWITCPTVLRRFQRDWDVDFTIPTVEPDRCIAGEEVSSNGAVVLEEYPLEAAQNGTIAEIAAALAAVCDDPVWRTELVKRLVLVSDENFQHFVTAATEIVARIQMDPKTRTNKQLFNQENVPCEALFYSVCTILSNRRPGDAADPDEEFKKLFPGQKALLQIGGDETVGLGLCEVKLLEKQQGGKE